MQIDFHHHAIFYILRRAGFKPRDAQVVASACQYVDDNNVDEPNHIETAHHPTDYENLSKKDQQEVWVPFHFIPGGFGDTLSQQLICVMDSPIANEVVSENLTNCRRDFSAGDDESDTYLMQFGIALHAYMDTFSHYGFSGISSKYNRVHAGSMQAAPIGDESVIGLLDKFKSKYGKESGHLTGWRKHWELLKSSFAGEVAEMLSGALGHGAVLTFPDKPWLHWTFEWEENLDNKDMRRFKFSNRSNPDTYLTAIKALWDKAREAHSIFYGKAVGANGPERKKMNLMVNYRGTKQTRMEHWESAALRDNIVIPPYIKGRFTQDTDDYKSEIYDDLELFHSAAKRYQCLILDDVLPKHGIDLR